MSITRCKNSITISGGTGERGREGREDKEQEVKEKVLMNLFKKEEAKKKFGCMRRQSDWLTDR